MLSRYLYSSIFLSELAHWAPDLYTELFSNIERFRGDIQIKISIFLLLDATAE